MNAFEVLAEPARRRILDLVREDEKSVGELVTSRAMSQPAVSKHLRVLREEGFVEARVDGQKRLYQMKPPALAEVEAWLEPYRRLWAERLDGLARYLEETQAEESRKSD